jgi:hypothetical protein
MRDGRQKARLSGIVSRYSHPKVALEVPLNAAFSLSMLDTLRSQKALEGCNQLR